MKARAKNALFGLIAVTMFFAICELGLRIARFSYFPDDTPLVVMKDFQRDTYKTLYRFDPVTLWTLVPGALYEKEGTTEGRINSLGFRGPEITPKKPAAALRIVCLGDSSTFGLGVRWRHTYEAQLQQYLTRALPGRKIEVVNAGVVGFTSTQALARLRRDVLPLSPDIVVIAVGAINEVYRVKNTDAQRIAAVSNAGRMRNIRETALKLRIAQLALWLVRKAATHGKPATLTPRAPLEQFNTDLDTFATLARQHHFKLIILSPHRKKKIDTQYPELAEYTNSLEQLAQLHNLTLVDVHGYFRNIDNEPALFRDDFHPSPAGHNLIARMLAYNILKTLK